MAVILTVMCMMIVVYEGFKILFAPKIRKFFEIAEESKGLSKEEHESRTKDLMNNKPSYFLFVLLELGYMLTALVLLLTPLYLIGVLLLALSLINFVVGKVFKVKVKPAWYLVLDSLASIIIVVYAYQTVLN